MKENRIKNPLTQQLGQSLNSMYGKTVEVHISIKKNLSRGFM